MKNRTVENLLDHLSNTMKNLDKKKITVDEALAHAKLVKGSNDLLRYELSVRVFEFRVEQYRNGD